MEAGGIGEMLKAIGGGHRISKRAFEAAEPELRLRLLEVQRALHKAGIPVIVIIAGSEGSGRSAVVNRLNTWLDARGLRTWAFWDESDEEAERPRYWRFWRRMPAAGEMAIFFGSWYTHPILGYSFGGLSEAQFQAELVRISSHERMLTDAGTLIVKLWFHVPEKVQRERKELEASRQSRDATAFEKSYFANYERFEKAAGSALTATHSGTAPWHVIDAHNKRYRDHTAAQLLLAAFEQRLANVPVAPDEPADLSKPKVSSATLDKLDLGAKAKPDSYKRQITRLQHRLTKLAWQAREQQRSTVALFEGWDAAGKGGAIRRVTAALDARLYQEISIAAPTDEEAAHHYLWRFWRHLPRAGYFTIYDRSWYGRLLVERVEGFAQADEWRRAYAEINSFEAQLADHGICLLKFWLHISPEEQLARFREREVTAHKVHKITDEDWRNRERWHDYLQAMNDILQRTDTSQAPWVLVPANDKRHARIAVLKAFCKGLERSLEKPD